MGNAVADSVSDPNNDKRFRLLQDEEGAPPSPLPKGEGNPPRKPPIAPPVPAGGDPEREDEKNPVQVPQRVNLELQVMELKQENDQLICALYYLQQELKELRGSK